MKFAKALHAVRALCRLGLQAEQFVPELLAALHAVVPSDRNLFDWTDERANLVRYFFEGPIDARIAQLYFDEFHNRLEAQAMPPFQALASLPGGVRGAEELATPHFFGSALYHEIWKPQGLHTRIEAVLRGRDGRLLGSLVLYRAPRDPPFTAEEQARLGQLLPDIAQGLVACGPAVRDEALLPAPTPPETLLLTADGQVCHASPGVHALLLLCQGGASPERLALPLSALVQRTLPELAAWLHPRAGQPPPHERVLVRETPGGALQARATVLLPQQPPAGPLVQLTLRRLEPHRLALERALRALPLTPGQAAVVRELYHGAAQPEVAARLGVAPATVIDHVRKAYGALGLRSAQELRALLDRRLLAGA